METKISKFIVPLLGVTLGCGANAMAASTKHFAVVFPTYMEEWLTAVPMISTDGGKTGEPMSL